METSRGDAAAATTRALSTRQEDDASRRREDEPETALVRPGARRSAAVAAEPLDAPTGEGDAARRLVGWTMDQAQGFVAGQQKLFAERKRRPLASLRDVVAYVARHEPPPMAPAAERRATGGGLGRTPLAASWAEAAAVLSASLPASRRWAWAEVETAAKRLRRRPCEVRLDVPTLAGAAPLRAAHTLYWGHQERLLARAAATEEARTGAATPAADVAVAARNAEWLRAKGDADLSALCSTIRSAEAGVTVSLDDGLFALDMQSATAEVRSPPPVMLQMAVDGPRVFQRGATMSSSSPRGNLRDGTRAAAGGAAANAARDPSEATSPRRRRVSAVERRLCGATAGDDGDDGDGGGSSFETQPRQVPAVHGQAPTRGGPVAVRRAA